MKILLVIVAATPGLALYVWYLRIALAQGRKGKE